MSIGDSSVVTLELNKITERLSAHAATESSRALCRSLAPSDDIYYVRKNLGLTAAAVGLIGIKGTPPISDTGDICDSIDRAEKGAALSPRELLEIARQLTTARRCIAYIDENRTEPCVLDEVFHRLLPNKSIEDRINRSIISEDMISDDASPALSDIRRKMKSVNNKIKETLQKYTQGGAYSKYLQENIVTMRNGRYVIPVKSEYRSEVKGLLHDTSSSGATYFIEPVAIVEANNSLRELQSEEEHEISRILYELSSDCSAFGEQIKYNNENISEIAFVFAKGLLALEMNASMPRVNGDGRVYLHRARHPLISKDKVVSINIMLGGEFDTLVITGPNTGGKTVTLKTLGLLCLMAQCGLFIPAADDSEVSVFTEILADIGDEQSIEQSLSTFSAHMKNIVGIMDICKKGSLVLFDELGAGTDPVEGAALAVSILDEVKRLGALCAATTHYAELKAYALSTDRVCNASCEFDIETLKPTYRLIIGTPGRSNAFAISQKLGLKESIIAAAREHIDSDNKRFEEVIEELESSRIKMEREQDAAEAAKKEALSYKTEAERTLAEKTERAERELENALKKAQGILRSAQASSDFIFRELDKLKKKQDSENFGDELEKTRRAIKERLKRSDDKINPVVQKKNEDYVLPRPLVRGDRVKLINVGIEGTLADDPDKNGNVTVLRGSSKTKTTVSNLMLVEEGTTLTDSTGKKKGVSAYAKPSPKSFSPEIDVRGMNGEEAKFVIDKYIDDACLAGIKSATIIHGKGTGALRAAIQSYLKADRRIKSYRAGAYGEGEYGVTVIEIK